MFKIISSKHTFSKGNYFLSDFGKEVLYKIAHKTFYEDRDLRLCLSCNECPLNMAIMDIKSLKSDDEWDYSKDCTEQITKEEFYNWMYENWWRFLIKEDRKETEV